jgi:hypothetical protein
MTSKTSFLLNNYSFSVEMEPLADTKLTTKIILRRAEVVIRKKIFALIILLAEAGGGIPDKFERL